MALIDAQLKQWRGLSQSNYAIYLYENGCNDTPYNVSYPTIKNHLEKSLQYFESSKSIIDQIEQTVDYLDWIIIDKNNGGIRIDFDEFTIASIDFYYLKWNLYQNYGSALISRLLTLPIDLDSDRHRLMNKAIDNLMSALQVLIDFDVMMSKYEEDLIAKKHRSKLQKKKRKKSRRNFIEISSDDQDDENDDDEDDIINLKDENEENNPTSIKLNKHKFRIPRSFFGCFGSVNVYDSDKSGCGLKQDLLDKKMRTYFELTKAYIALNRISDADTKFEQGLTQLLKRSNHGRYVEINPPESWWQLIQAASRFYMKYDRKDINGKNKALSMMKQILAFYQDNEIDIDHVAGLLLENTKVLMYDNNPKDAILANEQIKQMRYDFEKDIIQEANDNIYVIHGIMRRKNDLNDLLQFIKMDDQISNFYDWIRKFNIEVMKEVLYDEYWSVEVDDNYIKPPIQIIVDIMEFVLGCVYNRDFEPKKLCKIDLYILLKGINDWNGTIIDCDDDQENEKKNDHDEDDQGKDDKEKKLKVITSKINRKDAQSLIDFLHVKSPFYSYCLYLDDKLFDMLCVVLYDISLVQ